MAVKAIDIPNKVINMLELTSVLLRQKFRAFRDQHF